MSASDPQTAREKMAERLCVAAFHWHLDAENESWQGLWLRVADAALAGQDERAAAELRKAAEEDAVSSRALNEPGIADLRVVIAHDLRARADALDPRQAPECRSDGLGVSLVTKDPRSADTTGQKAPPAPS